MAVATRSAAVKRLMKEFSELQNDPSPEFQAYPLENNIFEWHFTIRGPNDDEAGFKGGRYHGRIIFNHEYPFKPPHFYFLTPNGRFECGKKICLSITGHHPEYWRPAWGVRTALTALISFLPTPGDGAIGALDWTPEERRECAARSREWGPCSTCGSYNKDFPDQANVPSEPLRPDPDISFTMERVSEGGATVSARDQLAAQHLKGDVASPLVDNDNFATSAPSAAQGSSKVPISVAEEYISASNSAGASTTISTPGRSDATRAIAPHPRTTMPGIERKVRQVDNALAVVMFLLAILVMRRLSDWL